MLLSTVIDAHVFAWYKLDSLYLSVGYALVITLSFPIIPRLRLGNNRKLESYMSA